jgi:hypothetical protein
MKIVMTVMARDEADIIGAQLAFHLNAGVDFVIATDHRSADGTTEIFRDYQRQGVLELIEETGPNYTQSEWVTRMARLAATKHAADWVINSDADEFWYPRTGNLKDVLGLVPPRYGAVQAFFRHFVPRPDDARDFAERMTVRFRPLQAVTDPTAEYPAKWKVVHRADPDVTIGQGNHAVTGVLPTMRGWYPIELFHFPIRSTEQCERKYVHLKESREGITKSKYFRGQTQRWHDAARAGTIAESYGAIVVDDAELERGLEAGVLIEDTRLRDALRVIAAAPEGRVELGFERPSVVDEQEYAAEAALVVDAWIVRVQRQVDRLEARLNAHERSFGSMLKAAARRWLRRR